MYMKWIGAALIISACGGFGIRLALWQKKEEQMLYQLLSVLHYMIADLSFRMTPLPALCRQASFECTGSLQNIFNNLAFELEKQISANVSASMEIVLSCIKDLPESVFKILNLLGHSMGKFSLDGQLQYLNAVSEQCQTALHNIKAHRETRLRGYQTIALCCGAALVILFV